MIPGRAIKVRVGSKSTKGTHTHTRTNLFGLLELQFGHPLLKSCRWLLLPLLSYLHFPNNALRPLVWLTETFFSVRLAASLFSLSAGLWGDGFSVCVSPAPPVLFCYPALLTTPTADPAVIRTSPTKAAAVRAVDGRCCKNSGKANLSPCIAIKLCQTRLLPSLLSYCPPLRSSCSHPLEGGCCGAARSIALNAIQVMTPPRLRSQPEATKHSFSNIGTPQNKIQQRTVAKFIWHWPQNQKTNWFKQLNVFCEASAEHIPLLHHIRSADAKSHLQYNKGRGP